jgi:hypothetical protein
MMKYLKSKGYKNIVNNNMFLMAEGDLPIILVSHMDTVFAVPPHTFYYDQEQTVLWSPEGLGADDRAGVYAIIELIERGFRPSIVLTQYEERGGVGADALVEIHKQCPFKNCKAIIQLDRRGYDDSVYYDCDNAQFEETINCYGFKTALGTFSDISIIAPVWGIAAVNLSCGYEREHFPTETLNLTWLNSTIEKVANMLKDCDTWSDYAYIPKPYIPVMGNWWTQDHCVCCGKELKRNEGYYCNATANSEKDFKVCEDCYAAYFPNDCPDDMDMCPTED